MRAPPLREVYTSVPHTPFLAQALMRQGGHTTNRSYMICATLECITSESETALNREGHAGARGACPCSSAEMSHEPFTSATSPLRSAVSRESSSVKSLALASGM